MDTADNQEVIQFKDWKCNLFLGKYGNDRLAIELVSAEEDLANDLFLGEPIATATVNLPNISLNDNEIIIKNYSENEGMLEALKNAGYISDTIKTVQTGFVTAHIVQKTQKLKNLENQTLNTTPKFKM